MRILSESIISVMSICTTIGVQCIGPPSLAIILALRRVLA
jgi:hypothetical protein